MKGGKLCFLLIKLNKLWKMFLSNKSSLMIDEYKSIADLAITLAQKGEISAEEARKMLSAINPYYNG